MTVNVKRISLVREQTMRWRLIVPQSPKANDVMSSRRWRYPDGNGKAVEWLDADGHRFWAEYFYLGLDALDVLASL